MWRIERTPGVLIGPRRWQWIVILTSYGMVSGHAWTRRQASQRLYHAQQELFTEAP